MSEYKKSMKKLNKAERKIQDSLQMVQITFDRVLDIAPNWMRPEDRK